MIELLEQALCRSVRLWRLENNTQCFQATETVYSAALRHLPRTEGTYCGRRSDGEFNLRGRDDLARDSLKHIRIATQRGAKFPATDATTM